MDDILGETIKIVKDSKKTIVDISKKSGIHTTTILNWVHGVVVDNANVFYVNCVLNSLGYDLKIVKKEEASNGRRN